MLELNNIKVVFNEGTVNERVALSNINLKLNKGDFVTIIGSNGAGKSTLFNAICGSLDLKEGTVYLDEENITQKPEYQRARFIGRLFQDPLKGTAPSMTIEENLSIASQRGKHFSLKLFNRYNKDEYRKVLKLLDLGLEERLNTKVRTLSGGQRQALTLLMATLVTPKLLLLDEHTASLDPLTARKILDISNTIIKEKNITTIMITHNMEDALKYGNKTIIMKDGSILLILEGEQRKNMNVEDLITLYSSSTNEYNDKILLK